MTPLSISAMCYTCDNRAQFTLINSTATSYRCACNCHGRTARGTDLAAEATT